MDKVDQVIRIITSTPVPLDPNTPIRKYSHSSESVADKFDKRVSTTPRYISNTQRELLGRVAEKGHDIDYELASYCSYYPLFVFTRFTDKKTGDLVTGHKFVCKNCTKSSGNSKCRHNFGDTDSPKQDKIDKVVQTILRRG